MKWAGEEKEEEDPSRKSAEATPTCCHTAGSNLDCQNPQGLEGQANVPSTLHCKSNLLLFHFNTNLESIRLKKLSAEKRGEEYWFPNYISAYLFSLE